MPGVDLNSTDASALGVYPLEANGNDISSKSNNLTLNGSITFQSVPGLPFGQKVPGSFSDTNYYSAKTALLNQFSNINRLTISFYVYATSLGNGPCPIAWNNGSLNFLQMMATGAVKFSYNDGGGIFIQTSAGVVTTNTWYHIAITMDGKNNNLYINRVFQGRVANAGNTGTVNAIAIGRLQPNGTFALAGYIKGVKITTIPYTVFPLI